MASTHACVAARIALAILLTAGLAPAALAQTTLYHQTVFNDNGFSSTYDPTAVFAFLAADNFTLTAPARLDQVRWWGSSDNFALPELQNFTQFKVTLYPRLASGLPGAPIYQEAFATAATSPVDSGPNTNTGSRVWQQTATLTTPQTLAAGDYMLTVGVSQYVDNQGSIWFWNLATEGDGFLAFDAYDGSGWQQFSTPTDLAFELLGQPQTAACYPNCDQSTTAPILNVADFTCFLQKYAAGDPYANCDASTTPPILNVADFTCFLQKYAAGCP